MDKAMKGWGGGINDHKRETKSDHLGFWQKNRLGD